MSLGVKLKLNIETPLVLLEATKDIMQGFREYEIKTTLAGKSICQIIFFALNKNMLDTNYPKIVTKLADDTIFWIAYPKKSSGIASDLLRDEGWSVVSNSEYQIVSSVSIDDIWSGVRIKKRNPNAKYKRDIPIAERQTEGIDFVKRTVSLPKDAIAAMKSIKGLEDFFNSMAFTHKKEYVEAIVDAKKPETRQRRIEKMIEMVSKLKMDKENKKKK